MDGDAAWAMIESANDPFDLVVTDIEMPGCSGFELTRRIRANPAFEHLPILAMSTLNDMETLAAGKDIGVNSHVVKLDDDQLVAAMCSATGTAQ